MGGTENVAPARRRQRPYRCFLIRCWQEPGTGPGGEPGWRFTVQQVGPEAARRSFACVADVEAYLEAELDDRAPHVLCGPSRDDPA